jgi:type I restriction enzyme, S subunit
MEQREGYKKTAIGWIPEDWEWVKIGENCLVQGGFSFKSNDFVEDGIPLIRISNIGKNGFLKNNLAHVPKIFLNEKKQFMANDGDILMALSGATTGKNIKIDSHILPAFINQRVGRFVIKKKSKLDNAFLLYAINFPIILFRMLFDAIGGAQPNISPKQIEKSFIPLPPLPEQTKIADILTTVDDKISSIDSQIQQTEQLKKGLMEKLLTEGIGHTEFKETEIGRIPKEWDVVRFEDVSINFDGKRIPIKSEDRQNMKGEYPYYGAQGIIDHVNDYIFYGEYLLIAEDGENVKSRKNDIAFIANGKFWVNNHAHIVQANELSILCYLKFVLNFIDTKKYITGMAQPKLNKGKLNSILIQLPSLPEQKQIATILSTVDDKLDILTQKKSYYQILKKGLSQQLLTGQMRVKV